VFPDGRNLAAQKNSTEFKFNELTKGQHSQPPFLAYTDKQPFTTQDLLSASGISELSSYRP